MAEDQTATTGATKEFLSAEQAAQELVKSLRKLNDTAESYAAADTKLRDVGRRLESLADATKDTGDRVADGVKAMQSMSGPEILKELANAQEMLRVQQGEIATSFEKLASALDGVAQRQLKASKRLTMAVVLAGMSMVLAAGALIAVLAK